MTAEEIQHEDDLLIINDVARAVEEDEFVPYVQPCFSLGSRTVRGAETLIRWTLADGGTVVPAGAFVPSLERTHTICGLDWCMVDAMCEFLHGAQGTPGMVPVALNMSSQHAEDEDFAQKLCASADWRGIDRAYLSVEMSARLVLSDERVRDVLIPSVLAAGFGVIADNFDEEADALHTLSALGIRTVKVVSAHWRRLDVYKLRELLSTAEDASIDLVAEGVETEDELRKITDAGFVFAQGFALAYPMSLEDFVALVS